MVAKVSWTHGGMRAVQEAQRMYSVAPLVGAQGAAGRVHWAVHNPQGYRHDPAPLRHAQHLRQL